MANPNKIESKDHLWKPAPIVGRDFSHREVEVEMHKPMTAQITSQGRGAEGFVLSSHFNNTKPQVPAASLPDFSGSQENYNLNNSVSSHRSQLPEQIHESSLPTFIHHDDHVAQGKPVYANFNGLNTTASSASMRTTTARAAQAKNR